MPDHSSSQNPVAGDFLENHLRLRFFDLVSHHPQATFFVAVSGGVDSLVLLHLLQSLFQAVPQSESKQINLSVIHVNHGLSPNALMWQKQVEGYCQQFNIPCVSEKVVIEGRANLEEVARKARYAVFHNILNQESLSRQEPILVLGHHLQDMAEHFFLNLMRASGVAGLSGKQELEQHYLGFLVWRPLLDIPKDSLRDYAQQHQIQHVHDESNDDIHFSRNYIRHQVVPVLESRWTAALDNIRQTQQWCQESNELAQDLAKVDFEFCYQDLTPAKIPSLKIEKFQQLSQARQKNLLRYFLQLHGVQQIRQSLYKQISQTLVQMHTGKTEGQQPEIQVCGERQLFLSVAYQVLYIFKKIQTDSTLQVPAQKTEMLESEFQLKSVARLKSDICLDSVSLYPEKLCLQLPAIDGVVAEGETQIQLHDQEHKHWYWRLPSAQEKLQLPHKPFPMTFKKLWQEWKIPKPIRARWPVLYNHQGEIICVPMIWCSQYLCHNTSSFSQ